MDVSDAEKLFPSFFLEQEFASQESHWCQSLRFCSVGRVVFKASY